MRSSAGCRQGRWRGCWGKGVPTVVARASGMSRNTVLSGVKSFERVRKSRRGGCGPRGRPTAKAIDVDPELLVILDSLVEPDARGDPMSPLRWTVKSTRQLAAELTRLGHRVGADVGRALLH